jgi:hypothetical protein
MAQAENIRHARDTATPPTRVGADAQPNRSRLRPKEWVEECRIGRDNESPARLAQLRARLFQSLLKRKQAGGIATAAGSQRIKINQKPCQLLRNG